LLERSLATCAESSCSAFWKSIGLLMGRQSVLGGFNAAARWHVRSEQISRFRPAHHGALDWNRSHILVFRHAT
jgi:hypothetical protein